MSLQLAGFTVGKALVFVYADIDKPQFLSDIEAWLSTHDATPMAEDNAALLMADCERWLAEQDLSAMEANIAAQNDMDEQYYQGWMT